jgi:hypothetical protein
MIQTNRGPVSAEFLEFLENLHDIADGIAARSREMTEAEAADFLERELADMAMKAKCIEDESDNPAPVQETGFHVEKLIRDRVAKQLED